ncbi:AsnC family transcriptional regulator, partial [Saccharomonospora iraqiensis]|uniref:AsnC family transcriptional regulator n=1 Tax=Saccharomonospora iraqiensis TaxID=52698 RepID=UPI000594B1B8
MSVTDPVDARLLAALAEAGKVAVHELAATVGMDPRDVASRLVDLSSRGLPLLVGVESDPAGLRSALARTPGAPPGPAPNAPGSVPPPPQRP